MKKIFKYVLIGVIALVAYNCEDESVDDASVNFVSFDLESRAETVAVGEGSKTVEINVYAGNVTGSDRTLELSTEASTADPSAYAVPSSVTIPSGTNVGTIPVVLNEAGLDFVFSSIVIELVPNGSVPTSGSTEISAGLVCPTASEVTISIVTDAYPEETSWTLMDGSGAMVASGGPYNGQTNTTITTDLSLPAGTFTMTLFDSYGDGGSTFSADNGCSQTLASGATPDAGGGYPVETSITGGFIIE